MSDSSSYCVYLSSVFVSISRVFIPDEDISVKRSWCCCLMSMHWRVLAVHHWRLHFPRLLTIVLSHQHSFFIFDTCRFTIKRCGDKCSKVQRSSRSRQSFIIHKNENNNNEQHNNDNQTGRPTINPPPCRDCG